MIRCPTIRQRCLGLALLLLGLAVSPACSEVAVEGTEIVQVLSDGTVLSATYARPTLNSVAPALILMHQPGASRDRHDFDDVWAVLQSYGIALLAPDLRSHGQSDPTGEIDDLRLDPAGYPVDLGGWLDFIAERQAEGDGVDRDRVGLIGLGTSGALVAAAVGRGGAACAVSVSGSLAEVNALATGFDFDEVGGDPNDGGGGGDDDDSAGEPGPLEGVLPLLELRDTRWIYGSSDEPAAGDAALLHAATSGSSDLVPFDGDLHGLEILQSSSEAKESIADWCLDLL